VTERLRLALAVPAEEWPSFSRFAGAFFLLSLGIEFGRIGRDSYFLKTAGVGAIPLMYVLIAALMVVAAPLYARLLQRVPLDRMMIAFQMYGGAGLLALWIGVSVLPNPPRLLPYAVFPLVEAFLLFLLMHFWTFAAKGVDAWHAPRLFPYIIGAGLFGALSGGLTSRIVVVTVGSEHLLAVWALLLLGTIPFTRSLAAHVRPAALRGAPTSEATEAGGPERTGGGGFVDILRQPLLRTMTYMALPMWIIIYIVEYSYFDAANRVFADQDALAGFLGIVVSISAATGLLMQFTVTPRLIRRFGVGATSVVYPGMLTLGASLLLFFSIVPGSEASSLPLLGIALLPVIARWCDVAFFFSVHDAVQQLLLYAVPGSLRDRSRVLMSAVVTPASIAAAGGLLIAFRWFDQPTHNIAFVAISLAFLLMVLALSVAPEYLRALLADIGPEAVEHRKQVMSEIAKLPTNDARYVLLQSVTADDEQEARFAVEHLFSIKDDELLNDMLESAASILPSVLRDIESRMTDEERLVHADRLTGALQMQVQAG
jgi:hypothetical protein